MVVADIPLLTICWPVPVARLLMPRGNLLHPSPVSFSCLPRLLELALLRRTGEPRSLSASQHCPFPAHILSQLGTKPMSDPSIATPAAPRRHHLQPRHKSRMTLSGEERVV